MKINLRGALLSAALLGALCADALQLPDIFSPDMMLQQNSNAAIWGWADPSSKVTVETSWDGKTYTVYADRTGAGMRVSPPPQRHIPLTP